MARRRGQHAGSTEPSRQSSLRHLDESWSLSTATRSTFVKIFPERDFLQLLLLNNIIQSALWNIYRSRGIVFLHRIPHESSQLRSVRSMLYSSYKPKCSPGMIQEDLNNLIMLSIYSTCQNSLLLTFSSRYKLSKVQIPQNDHIIRRGRWSIRPLTLRCSWRQLTQQMSWWRYIQATARVPAGWGGERLSVSDCWKDRGA